MSARRRGPRHPDACWVTYRLFVERLEDRVTPVARVGDVFAQFAGVVGAPGETTVTPITLSSSDLTLPGGAALLGIQVKGLPAGGLDPAAVVVRDGTEQLLVPVYAAPDASGRTASMAIFAFGFGSYTVTVGGEHDSAGEYLMEVTLAGDAIGNHRVDDQDRTILLDRLGEGAGSPRFWLAADGNRDGRIDATDLSYWERNRRVEARLTPMVLAIYPLPLPAAQLPDGTWLANDPTVLLQGPSAPGARIAVDADADGEFDDGATTAGPDGRYAVRVPVAAGVHTLSVRASDTFGQMVTRSVRVERDVPPPTVTATLATDTAPDGGTNADGVTADPTVVGTVGTSAGVSEFRAGFDATPAGSFADVSDTLQPDNRFTLTRARLEAVNGGPLADGTHTLHLRATDNEGQSSAVFDLTFTLDTQPPPAPAFDLAPESDTAPIGDHKTTAARVALVGQTEPSARVTLTPSGATTTADATGAFRFPDIALAVGQTTYTVQAVDAAGNTSSFALPVERTPVTTTSDAVLDWNQTALDAIQHDASAPPVASRALAMVSAAVSDALSAIGGSPALYVRVPASPGALPEAAAAAAAHRVLSYLYPAQAATFDAALAAGLAAVPDGPSKTDGVALGRAVADAIIAQRKTDGWDTFVDYQPSSGPGAWQPTPPAFAEALLPQWGQLKPFLMADVAQFLPAGPPALDSAEWATDFNETKSLGSATSATRTADQTQIAKFWADGSGTVTPVGHWNEIAAQVAKASGNSLADNARLFAQLNLALADAAIVAWAAKYQYAFWRPVTAIRAADTDGNDATDPDAGWTSLLPTPNFPEYVSGHSTFSGAAEAVLSAFFGGNVGFTTGSPSLPGVQRAFASFHAAAEEAGRSRIYGGIHYESSNQDGLAAGRAIGASVVDAFRAGVDIRPPTVSLATESGQVTATNVTLTGQVLDLQSGLQSLEVQTDDGAFTPIPLDALGHFTLTTAFALDGTADGAHTLRFRATDTAGNASTPTAFTFTLDTQAPALTITAPTNNGTLAADAHLTGTLSATGSPIVAFSYRFDTGPSFPLTPAGAFDLPLDLSRLAPGPHTLTVSATDAAGHTTTQTLAVSLPTAVPLTVTEITPSGGSDDVGVTVRPKVVFSRPIDVSTLTADNFYLTDSTGAKIAATISPSADGTYTWLFHADPFPGSSTVTLTVDGSTVRAADGSLLDAAGDGTAGSVRRVQFTTVSTAPLPNTTITGVVADPGTDLKPMTFDDLRAGPDGVLMTADDLHLNPIAGVKVYLLGLEGQAVFTDAQGRFTLSSVPAGTVKLALDGRTATNAPAGYYFPEMVMDLTVRPGQANTVMGGMGTREEQAANADLPGVWLPRLKSSILQTVSNTAPTVITVPAEAAPDLTAEQRGMLTATVTPGTALDADGRVMSNVQVGISTVPVSLIRDMLPQGVKEPPFTITVQAPGVMSFTTPVQLTYPNLDGSAPGTKLLFISFDHATGKLIVDGTATVTADGKMAVTDPDGGLTHPGWHFVTQGAVNGDSIQLQDLTKLEGQNKAQLIYEYYPGGYVDQNGTITPLGTQLISDAKSIFDLAIHDGTVSRAYFSNFLAGGGDLSATTAINMIAAQKILNDKNFQTLVVQKDKDLILQAAQAAKRAGSPGSDFNVTLQPNKFGFQSRLFGLPSDLQIAFSSGDNLSFKNVSGSGDVNEEGTAFLSGSLTYTGSLIWGYGYQNAFSPKYAGQSFGFKQPTYRGLRLLQLLGQAKPFTTTVTITVPLTEASNLSQFQNATANSIGVSSASFSTAQEFQANATSNPTGMGLGSNPSINYRFDLSSGASIIGKADSSGKLGQPIFTANTNYTGTFYQTMTNLWTSVVGNSGPDGTVFGLVGGPSVITLDHFGGTDTDNDGIPDIGEYVLGTNPNGTDSDGDGVSDGAEVDQGLDPLGGRGFPTGVVSTLPIQGTAEKVAVDGDRIYVATGGYGLAILDGTQFDKPMVLGQLNLPGDATGIGVDADLKIAAVATGPALQLVDVSDGTQPKVVGSVNAAASLVEVADGLAYAVSGTTLRVVDLAPGSVLQTLTLPGSGFVTGFAREGTFLYAFVSGSDTLSVIDISTEGAVVRGQVVVSVASPDVGLFVGNGVAWLSGSGLRTIDVNNPAAPTVIQTPTGSQFLTARRLALNGSGLGLLVPDGGNFLQVYDTSSPRSVANLLLQLPLSANARDVAVSRGLAYVAEGNRIEVVNYLPFDNKLTPPVVSISTTAADADPTRGGLQVFEGSSLPVRVSVTDDVQVRGVELLVNGQVVGNDVSFPFDFAALAPVLTAGADSFTLQVRATDTGGNVAVSNVLTVGLVNDTTSPTITAFTPLTNSSQVEPVQTVRVRFSKPMDATTVTADTVRVRDAAGNFFTPTAFQLRDDGRLAQLTFAPLPTGTYRIVVNGAAITDRAGNVLAAADVTSGFTLTPRATLTTTAADADPGTPGVQVLEGATVPVTVAVASGVAVQTVEVQVNDVVAATLTAAPYTAAVATPLLAAGASSFTLRARVTDTNGVTTVTAPLAICLVRDVTPPTVTTTNPGNRLVVQGTQALLVNFSEPLAAGSATPGSFRLIVAGPGGVFDDGNDTAVAITGIQLQNGDTRVALTTAGLAVGTYRLAVVPGGLTDRAGNALVTPFATRFTVVAELGLRAQFYDTPDTLQAVSSGFAGLTPRQFSVTTATGTVTASSRVIPTINFPDTDFDTAAFFDVGANGVVDAGSTATSPRGDDISIQPPGGNDNFGASFTGFLYLPTGGDVTFTVTVDDAFDLIVNGRSVVRNIGGANFVSFTGTARGLPVGLVPVTLNFGELGGEADLVLAAVGGGLPGGVIPSAYLSAASGSPQPQLSAGVTAVLDGTLRFDQTEGLSPSADYGFKSLTIPLQSNTFSAPISLDQSGTGLVPNGYDTPTVVTNQLGLILGFDHTDTGSEMQDAPPVGVRVMKEVATNAELMFTPADDGHVRLSPPLTYDWEGTPAVWLAQFDHTEEYHPDRITTSAESSARSTRDSSVSESVGGFHSMSARDEFLPEILYARSQWFGAPAESGSVFTPVAIVSELPGVSPI